MKNTRNSLIITVLTALFISACTEQGDAKPNDDAIAKTDINKSVQPNAANAANAVTLSEDEKLGKTKSLECASCHGSKGISYGPLWPNLAGLSSAYIEKQLKDFRSEKRENAMMNLYAKPLSDEDIKHLSAYYGSLKR